MATVDSVMGDAEMMAMKEHAGLEEEEWTRALAEARWPCFGVFGLDGLVFRVFYFHWVFFRSQIEEEVSKYIVVETKKEKRSAKPLKSTARVEKRFWEGDDMEDMAFDKRRENAEDDAFNSWNTNRRLWRGSEVDKEMALMRERVKMRQLQEKMRLVTQPVIPLGSEEKENVFELQEDQRFDPEDKILDDSVSSTPSQLVRPAQIDQSLQISCPNKTSKPKNNSVKNTQPASASKPICSEQRIKRGMASLEAILTDIIEAVKVAYHIMDGVLILSSLHQIVN